MTIRSTVSQCRLMLTWSKRSASAAISIVDPSANTEFLVMLTAPVFAGAGCRREDWRGFRFIPSRDAESLRNRQQSAEGNEIDQRPDQKFPDHNKIISLRRRSEALATASVRVRAPSLRNSDSM